MNIVERAARDLAEAEENFEQMRQYMANETVQFPFSIQLGWFPCSAMTGHDRVVRAVRRQIEDKMQKLMADALEDARTELMRARQAMTSALESARA